jgi:gamma-glutamyl:cysteine ligase YbdK (ATP-grasp superfamily)
VPDIAHPLFYCKDDGSLNNGVELVSHPGTFKWWQEQRGNVESVLQRVSRLGFRSHEIETCGMHVHVSNTAFENSMHIYRFLHLIYRYPTLALLVSQRNRRRLNQWATLRYSKKPQLKSKANILLKRREWATADSAGHYDAVNKTSHTMELRIFNGTLNPSRFYKNLQFCEAALRFTADTLNLRHVNARKFVEYVHANVSSIPIWRRS